MPLPTESLNKDSSKEQIQEAISKAIEQLINEGREPDQAKAIAYETAREATGGTPSKSPSKLKMRARGP